MENDKTWIYWKNTQAVGLKLKDDIKEISKVVDIVIQVVFIAYYIFSALTHLDNTLLHIVYSGFLLMALGYFGFHCYSITHPNRVLKNRVKRIIRYVKYPVRVLLITLSIVDLAMHGGTDMSKIALILSLVAFFTQIIVQIVLNFVNRYIDLFIESLAMDYERSCLVKAAVNSYSNPKPKEKGGFTNFIKNKAVSSIDKFIEENGGYEPPIVQLPKYQAKNRGKILELKEEYLGPDPKLPEIAQYDGPDPTEEALEKVAIAADAVEKSGFFGLFKKKNKKKKDAIDAEVTEEE